MPELALIGLVGFLLCVISTITAYFVEMRRYERLENSILQSNLKKLEKRWNNLKQLIEDDTEENRSAQKSSMSTTIFVLGFGLSLLSWVGLILFWITYFPIRVMGGSRLERQLLRDLDHQHLDRLAVQAILLSNQEI